jgi:hypothetical protein
LRSSWCSGLDFVGFVAFGSLDFVGFECFVFVAFEIHLEFVGIHLEFVEIHPAFRISVVVGIEICFAWN